jgi:hypothetical protein
MFGVKQAFCWVGWLVSWPGSHSKVLSFVDVGNGGYILQTGFLGNLGI